MLTRYASGSERITKYLIENGADVNIRGSENNSALCIAALNHRTENAKMLLEAGADTTLKNDEGKTAFDIAKEEDAKEIVELLENYGK
jgi:ankyrin repeat protein